MGADRIPPGVLWLLGQAQAIHEQAIPRASGFRMGRLVRGPSDQADRARTLHFPFWLFVFRTKWLPSLRKWGGGRIAVCPASEGQWVGQEGLQMELLTDGHYCWVSVHSEIKERAPLCYLQRQKAEEFHLFLLYFFSMLFSSPHSPFCPPPHNNKASWNFRIGICFKSLWLTNSSHVTYEETVMERGTVACPRPHTGKCQDKDENWTCLISFSFSQFQWFPTCGFEHSMVIIFGIAANPCTIT